MRIRFAFLLTVLAAGLIAHGEDSRDAFRRLHQELRNRMEDDLDAAAEYLETQIAADPESADLNVLRHSLATRLAEQQKYKLASGQFKQLLDFQIKHVDLAENQFGIWMTIQSLREITDESGNDTDLREAVAAGLASVLGVEHPEDTDVDSLPLDPIAQLTVLQAQFLVDDDKAEQAKTLIEEQLDSLAKLNQSDRATATSTQTWLRMLQALTSGNRNNDPWRKEMVAKLDQAVTVALDRFPDSPLIQNDYAQTQLMMIMRWGQDDPEATKERIENVLAKLGPFAVSNATVSSTLRRISLRKERLAAVKPASKLVGNPAPEWDIDAWVNVIEMDRKSLEGKVVLLDFWAMWCGPCVATFPHLREWREEFGGDDFEIVGVTSYYNYEWDEETQRASRSDGDVTAEDERRTLTKFLEHHQLEHPVIVMPDGSKMDNNYGARGIPHVVLIDQKGIVQLVKTGAGAATAKEIHAKIKELLKPADTEAGEADAATEAAEEEDTAKPAADETAK